MPPLYHFPLSHRHGDMRIPLAKGARPAPSALTAPKRSSVEFAKRDRVTPLGWAAQSADQFLDILAEGNGRRSIFSHAREPEQPNYHWVNGVPSMA